MATINSTERDAFLADLTADQTAAFETLEKLLSNKQDDFAWHHEVGRCIRTICPRDAGEERFGYEAKVIENLAAVLNRSSAPLYKKLRFATEYTQAEVQQLQQWQARGLTWTHLTHAFAAENKQKRWKLLREAAQQGWNSEQLKYKIRSRSGSRHPIGGRPPTRPKKQDYVAELERLRLLSLKWLNYRDHIWVGEQDPALERLRKNRPRKKPRSLKQVRAETRDVLEILARAAKKLRKSI
jgi:hypothetical protein